MLHITPDERQILRLLGAGQPLPTIAARLGIAGFDLELQVRTLFARMGAASAPDAVRIATRRGLLSNASGDGHLDNGHVDFRSSRSTHM